MRISWTLMIVAGWIALIGPGAIEGKLFPAAAPAEVTSVRVDRADPEWVIVSGKSARLRPSCSPRRLEWFRGERGGRDTSVDWDWGPPIVREDGAFEFVDWRIRAAPEEVLRSETHADVLHQCQLIPGIPSPWLTRSRFWR